MYAKITDGAVVQYPYTAAMLRAENPQTSFPETMGDEVMATYGAVTVAESPIPAHDPETQDIREGTPTQTDGTWYKSWEVTNRSPEEIAQRKSEQRQGMRLSFAQLLIGLVTEGWITEAEGEAWLAGTLPAAVLALIDTLPAAQQFAAKARAARPSVVVRSDPLVTDLGAAQGKTAAELDAFFTTYANA